MQCHACGNDVADDDRFCGNCGVSLQGVTDVTAPTPVVAPDPQPDEPVEAAETDEDEPAAEPDEPTAPTDVVADAPPEEAGPAWDVDPVWAATGQLPVTEETTAPAASITDALPATEPVTDVWVDATGTPLGPASTDQMQAVGSSTDRMPMVPTPIREPLRFRPGVVSGLALLGSILTMIATFATIVAVSSDQRIIPTPDTPPGFRTGSWIADDLAGNLSIAALVAVASLLAGGVAAAFGWRGGSGLAGGAGLAIAGLAALTIGLAQVPIDAAYDMAAIPTDAQFTLTITRDVGYWLQIVAGLVGLVVFFASVNELFGDRRPGLNPWIAALGALSALVLAGGPLLPEQLGVFSDNWYVNEAPGTAPALLLTGRIVQLSLIALAGVVGFLSVRRWGLGVAMGGTLPAIWLVLSTLFDLTDRPAGPGYLNPGATELQVHGVTIIGASAVLAFGVLALIAAYDQTRRSW